MEKQTKRKNFNESQITNVESVYNKIKFDVISKKEIFPIKIAKIINFFYLVVTIILFIINEIFLKNFFLYLSNYYTKFFTFDITKIYIGFMYISVTNIKWELHSCLLPNENYNYSEIYDQLIISNIDYILEFKDSISSLGTEYSKIFAKSLTTKLNIYGSNKTEEYQFKINNVLDFMISGGIDIIKEHKSLINLINNETSFNPLTYRYNELIDLQKITYSFLNSDKDGYSDKQKNEIIGQKSKDFAILCNAIFLFGIVTFYIIYLFRIHIIELYFLEKLIYFNSPNFEKYLKNLEEIKKKFKMIKLMKKKKKMKKI
jgi:hypothetical protein